MHNCSGCLYWALSLYSNKFPRKSRSVARAILVRCPSLWTEEHFKVIDSARITGKSRSETSKLAREWAQLYLMASVFAS